MILLLNYKPDQSHLVFIRRAIDGSDALILSTTDGVAASASPTTVSAAVISQLKVARTHKCAVLKADLHDT